MARVALWGVRDKKSVVVSRLYELGVFHLTTSEEAMDGSHRFLLEKLREQRGKALNLIEALRWDEWRKLTDAFVENVRYNLSQDLEAMTEEIERSLQRIQSRLVWIRRNQERLQNDFIELRKANLILKRAQGFLEQEKTVRGEMAIWRLPRQGQHALISKINGELDLLPSGHEKPWFRYHSIDFNDGSSYLVTSASYEVQPKIRNGVTNLQGSRWRLLDYTEKKKAKETNFDAEESDWTKDNADEKSFLITAPSRIARLLRRAPTRIRANREELRKLSDQWGANLAAVYILLNDRMEQLLMEASAEENEEFFSLEGWIPEKDLARTKAVLKEDFGDFVIVRSRPPDPAKDGVVPTALRNVSIFKPFELFLKLLRVPHYNAYDPTPLIGLFFPFFAGCMVGDIGYGVLILWVGRHLKQKKTETLRDVGVILLFVAFWSIFWGAMFGEFFGDVGHRLLHMRPIWEDRVHAILQVMGFSVALGTTHVTLGLLIGVIQGIRNRHRHHWMERLGSLLVIVSLVAALMFLRAQLPASFFSIPVILLIFALIFLIWGGGIGGIIESLSTIGNIISYVRIAAIGLSSAILAMVASTFVDTIEVPLVGLFMAFAIHLLNFVLAIGGSALHAARLHYVEFMGKFYEDGTLAYKPFAKRRSLHNG
jgi:V/A-type H+-transporting ATPase subunit I